MGELVQVAIAFVGVLFVVAAVGKADGWRSWSRAAVGFAGARAGRALAIGVPALEFAAAALAVVVPRVGIPLGALLLAALTAGTFALRRGHDGEECNCFGAVMPATIGTRLVARNAALTVFTTAVAVTVIRRGETSGLSLPQCLVALLSSTLLIVALEWRRVVRPIGAGAHV